MTDDDTLRGEVTRAISERLYDESPLGAMTTSCVDALMSIVAARIQASEERAARAEHKLRLVVSVLPPCSQCGQPFTQRACGPTHALIAANPAAHASLGKEEAASPKHLISFEKGSWSNPRARAVCVCDWKGEWSWSSTYAEAEGNLHLDMVGDPNQEPPGYSGGVSELGYEGDG